MEDYTIGSSNAYGSYSILIGEGLHTNKDYHLLVDRNGVKIDKIMTKEEYQLIMDITKALGVIK